MRADDIADDDTIREQQSLYYGARGDHWLDSGDLMHIIEQTIQSEDY